MSGKVISQTEAALVSAAREGDRDAIRELLRENWLWLKGLAYNILGKPEDVDDALQTICMLVIENIGSLREPERFKGWLATVARHAALAQREKRSRKPVQLTEVMEAEHHDAETVQPIDQLSREEAHEALLKAVEELPEKYREVFILKHIQEKSYADIAELLSIPVTTVQIRLVRARRMIYNRLTGCTNNKIPRT